MTVGNVGTIYYVKVKEYQDRSSTFDHNNLLETRRLYRMSVKEHNVSFFDVYKLLTVSNCILQPKKVLREILRPLPDPLHRVQTLGS